MISSVDEKSWGNKWVEVEVIKENERKYWFDEIWN